MPNKLPFDSIDFAADGKSVHVEVGKTTWKCELASYECTKIDGKGVSKPAAAEPEPSPQERRFRGRRDGAGEDSGRSGTSWIRSPDGQWEASVKDHNIVVRKAGDTEETRLSTDGKEGLAYGRLSWAPDSKTLVAFRIEPGDAKEVYLIESSPPGGGRASLQTAPIRCPATSSPPTS